MKSFLLLSTALVVACLYSPISKAGPSPSPFVYFVDDDSITDADLPAGISVISGFSQADRTALTGAGRIVGFTASMTGGSAIQWTQPNPDIVSWNKNNPTAQQKPTTLQQLFAEPSTANLSPTALATQIFNIAGVDVTQADAFPINSEASGSNGYVFYGQDIESNTGDGISNGAAAYGAIFWAARVLLPNMKIIPVPASAVQKIAASDWGIKNVIFGVPNGDNYLKFLKLASSFNSQQLSDINNNRVDLLSFLHLAKYQNQPLINGFLAQQYSCQPNGGNPCGKVNGGAWPGSFSSDTPAVYDKTLSFALMSAHDNPPQLQIPSPNPPAPWKSNYYLNNPQDLPFQAGVYWDENSSSNDFKQFIALNYLTPTSVGSMSAATTKVTPGATLANNKLTIKVTGGGAGRVINSKYNINCRSNCIVYLKPRRNGTARTITLTALTNSGSSFDGWNSSSQNKSKYFRVTVQNNQVVSAKFH